MKTQYDKMIKDLMFSTIKLLLLDLQYFVSSLSKVEGEDTLIGQIIVSSPSTFKGRRVEDTKWQNIATISYC